MSTEIEDMDKGLIFLIQDYSINDGPGIRTTVFLKGCPLRCSWCQNPESLKQVPELMTHDKKCIACGKCVDTCHVKAVTLNPLHGRKIDRETCDLCFECVDICPSVALEKVGEYMTVDQVMAEIEKSEIFMVRSNGGVTVSGGEPMMQSTFTHNLLKACKEKGLHTALDTCGYTPFPVFQKILNYVDLLLFDIKHIDPDAHMAATGKSNNLILENIGKIPRHVDTWLRIPLIPGYNDSDENLEKAGALGREIGARKISILPFNRLGDGKYHNLGKELPLAGLKPLEDEKLNYVKRVIEGFGINVTIGE